MARFSYDDAYKILVQIEGGLVDHPCDPGGRTNLGVTQLTYDRWRTSQGLPLRHVGKITPEEAKTLYFSLYWCECGAESLYKSHPALALALFDAGVHQGPAAAVKTLQRISGASDDGVFGAKTLASVLSCDEKLLVHKLLAARTKFLMHLARPGSRLSIFQRGWANRLEFISRIADDILEGRAFV